MAYRTKNCGQSRYKLNNGGYGYIDGNVALKQKSRRDAVRLTGNVRRDRDISKAKPVIRQKAFFVIAGIVVTAAVIVLAIEMFSALSRYDKITDSVRSKQKEYEKLTVYNDAREYDIESSVDLQEIIRAATEDLGMVRSNINQVVTFSSRSTEYIQQLARVPLE